MSSDSLHGGASVALENHQLAGKCGGDAVLPTAGNGDESVKLSEDGGLPDAIVAVEAEDGTPQKLAEYEDNDSDMRSASNEKLDNQRTVPADNQIGNTSSTMSKRQMKKLAKKQKYLAELMDRRRKEREARKLKRRAAKADFGEAAEGAAVKIKVKKMAESACKLRVALDFAYDDFMSQAELSQTNRQAMRCYSENRRAEEPLQLYFTHLGGESLKLCEKHSGFVVWDLHIESRPINEVFSPADIVYLTSESPNVLASLDPAKVYAIGAFVDHNHKKGASLERAEALGMGHARLPIDEHVDMKTRKVLSHYHVFAILLDVGSRGKSWTQSLCDNIPMRKGLMPKEKEKVDS